MKYLEQTILITLHHKLLESKANISISAFLKGLGLIVAK